MDRAALVAVAADVAGDLELVAAVGDGDDFAAKAEKGMRTFVFSDL